MSIDNVIAQIDAEIGRLNQVKVLLGSAAPESAVKRGLGRPKGTLASPSKKKRNLTPEGRARIAAAVRARWAKSKKKKTAA